ncbi:hypothetical protein [Streptomyces sp. ALB3]|uniref:hypothetical protein n=1 Tax=Streptomyces sp. ALB3 TaxID=3374278 RepID=UPI00379FB05E
MTAEQDCILTEDDLRLLTLLATYPSDEPIARHLGVSVRTVRRRVARIMELLDVQNRFAAGVAAAQLGWVTWGHNERRPKRRNAFVTVPSVSVRRLPAARVHSN